MKKITVNLILVMMCFFHFSVFAAEKFGKIEQTTIESEILTETRELVVYLPADYEESTQSFPVLYITDGDIQGPLIRTNTFGHFAKRVQSLNEVNNVNKENPQNTYR